MVLNAARFRFSGLLTVCVLVFSGCSSVLGTLESYGVVLSPYADIQPASSHAGALITSANQSQFRLEGQCGEQGGLVALIEPAALATETMCSESGLWSFTLDLSNLSDDVYQFRVRHYRADGKKFVDVISENFFKITQMPEALAGVPVNAAVSTVVTGSSFVVAWEMGYDSSGTPLVGYEVSVSTEALGGGTVLQEWTSVGTSTSTEINVPGGSSSEGSVFYVNIRGSDQAGQTTVPQSTSYEVDNLAPTFSVALSASASVLTSLANGPNFSWGVSDGAGSGIAKIEYRVITVGSGATVRTWTTLPSVSATSVALTGLSLAQGNSYRFEIRATDLAGNESAAAYLDWRIASPKLEFTSSPPINATLGIPFSLSVALQDESGVTLTSANDSVQLSAHVDSACTSAATGSLSGGSASAASGVANFSNVSWSADGTIYIKAAASGFASKCSNAVSISPPQLVFTTVPASTSIGTNFGITVTLKDASNNTLTSASNSVQIAAYSDSGCSSSASGSLTGGSATASSGVASFSGVQWNDVGTIYIRATSPGFTAACSSALSVGPANNPVPSVVSPDVWLKADAITGVSGGGALSTWNDSSANGRHFSSGVAPTYQTNQLNGLPAVSFSGSQYLKVAGSSLQKPSSFTIIAVLAPASITYSGYIYGAVDGSAASATSWGSLRQDTHKAIRYWGNGSTNATASSDSVFSVANQFQIIAQTVTSGQADNVLRASGSQKANASCSACSTASSGTSYDFSVGGIGDYAQRWSGKMAEILIYRAALSTSDLQKVEAYLSQKYQIATPLNVSRTGSGTLGLNANEQIQVTGGIPPYGYSVSGGGSITSSGLYTSASSGMGTSTVSVTDSAGTPQTSTVTIPWRDPSLLVCGVTEIHEKFDTTASLSSAPYSTTWSTFTDNGASVLSIDAGSLKVATAGADWFGGGLVTQGTFSLGVDVSMDLYQQGSYGCGPNDCAARGIFFYTSGSTPSRDSNYGFPTPLSTQGGSIRLLNSMAGRALLSTDGVFGTGANNLDIGTYALSTFQNLRVKINADSTYQVFYKGLSVYSGTLSGNTLSSPFKVEFYAGNYSSSAGAIIYKMDHLKVIRTDSGCAASSSLLSDAVVHLSGDYGITRNASNVITEWVSVPIVGHNQASLVGTGPTWSEAHSSFNNRPVVSLNGSGYLQDSAFAGTCSSAGTTRVIVLGNRQGGSSANHVFFADRLAGIQNYYGSLYSYSAPGNYKISSGLFSSGAINTAMILSHVVDTGLAQVSVRKDGTVLSGGTVGSPGSCVTSGTGLLVGHTAGGVTAVGDIAEVAIFDRPLTHSEIQSLEAELAAKYSISVAP